MYQTSTYLLEYVALSFALIQEDHQSTKHSSDNRAGHGSFIATRGNRCSKSFSMNDIGSPVMACKKILLCTHGQG